MSLISKVAYLKMCECGQHGNVVLADGTVLPEFCSKKAAQIGLKGIYKAKLISELEFKFLKNQISSMPHLAERDQDVDIISVITCDVLAELRKACDPMNQNPKNKYVM